MATPFQYASPGVQFLQRLADVCGVGVVGGVDYQLPDANWRLEGPTITVYPGGSQRSVLNDPANRFGLGEDQAGCHAFRDVVYVPVNVTNRRRVYFRDSK